MSKMKHPPAYGVPCGPIIRAFITSALSQSVRTNIPDDRHTLDGKSFARI